MEWEQYVDYIYDIYNLSYKSTIRQFKQYVEMDFEDLIIEVNDSVSKSLEKYGYETKRTKTINKVIKLYQGN